MAALTDDRYGAVELKPEGFEEAAPLTASEILYMHSLAVLKDSDGALEAATAASDGVVVYIDRHLEANGPNMRGSTGALAPFLNGVVVRLDSSVALTAADVGSSAYVVDDHTFDVTQTTTEPLVGTITAVIDAATADVYVPGLSA